MTTAWLILMVVVSIAFIINNTAKEFVRRDNERRAWDEMVNRQEAARLSRERAEIDHATATMRKAQRDLDKDYISDAEIVEEVREPKGLK